MTKESAGKGAESGRLKGFQPVCLDHSNGLKHFDDQAGLGDVGLNGLSTCLARFFAEDQNGDEHKRQYQEKCHG